MVQVEEGCQNLESVDMYGLVTCGQCGPRRPGMPRYPRPAARRLRPDPPTARAVTPNRGNSSIVHQTSDVGPPICRGMLLIFGSAAAQRALNSQPATPLALDDGSIHPVPLSIEDVDAFNCRCSAC